MPKFLILRHKILFCVVILLATASGVSQGQTDTLTVPDILGYLSEGNEQGLVSYADEYVELAILEQPRRYTNSQAVYVLKDFFHQYPPGRFELHHSILQDMHWWLTGNYFVRDEHQKLRVYLRFNGAFPSYRLIAVQVIRQ